MTCWAYYPDFGESGRVPEEFYRHSVDVAEYMFNDLGHVTASVIRKVAKQLGVSEDLVHDAVFLTGLLHDLGKTCVCYQEKPWRGFSGHWLLSASAMFNIITNPKYPAFDKDKPITLTSLFVLSILLHHYAQTDLLGRIDSISVSKFQVYNDCAETLRSLVDYGLGRVKSPIGRNILNDLLVDLSDNALSIYPMPEWVRGFLTSNLFEPSRLASIVIAGLLNEADGTVASRNRRW